MPSQAAHSSFERDEKKEQVRNNKIINKKLKKEKKEYDLVHRLLLLGKKKLYCYMIFENWVLSRCM